MNGCLRILTGEHQGGFYPLASHTVTLGRAPDNDIVLDDKGISRHHAQITYENKCYFIIDLNTPNGTYVNKRRVLNQPLKEQVYFQN